MFSNRNIEDIPPPILFLACGHSGTSPLAKTLEASGVYLGNIEDKNCLNATYDSLCWTCGFQRKLVPELFMFGAGCSIDDINERKISTTAVKCLKKHLTYYLGGRWGIKTCAGMFCHQWYNHIFPTAKYIYLVRDGRDVVLSASPYFHLSNPASRRQNWQYFKILTFGISNDIDRSPFSFPDKPQENDEVMRNKYWIQAKCWREHVLMMEHLRKSRQLSPSVFTIQYEKLCADPISVLEELFMFLKMEFDSGARDFAAKLFHTKSVGRWETYNKYLKDCDENMEQVFDSMHSELKLLGYAE